MTQRTRLIAHTLLALSVAAALSACAAGKDFNGVPQEGANRTGTFPTFGHMPKGETAQLTADDKSQLTASLDNDRQRLKNVRSEAGVSAAQLAQMRKQAKADADATLKAIENGEN